MKILTIATCSLLFLALPLAAEEVKSRNVVLSNVSAAGEVSDDLKAQTGWQTLRGLRYQILLVDAAGKETPVSPAGPFRTGQKFRVQVQSFCDLWIYVLNVDNKGQEVVLYPLPDEAHLEVRQGKTVTVPPGDRFVFVDGPGVERFYLIASPEKIVEITPAELLKRDNGKTLTAAEEKKASEQQAARSKSIGTLLKEQSSAPTVEKPLAAAIAQLKADPELRAKSKNVRLSPPPEDNGQDVVVASTSAADRSRILVELKLEHRP